MKAIMLMFDSLNRSYLPAYGCEWTQLPNFRRLQDKTLTFDNFYAGSLPCMPARRELHTGRYNFLHRSWGPLEPFDFSAIGHLSQNGVYTHLASDHGHYWEDGGATYHTRYNTWQFARGQEGDAWMGQVAEPKIPDGVTGNKVGNLWRQDWVNRQFLQNEADLPQTQTVDNGLDFIRRNAGEDRWFLQIELFDPHEPFFAPERLREKYPHQYTGKHLDWPDYGPSAYTAEETQHLHAEYAALLTLCDETLGRVLDEMDARNLWDDTMLVVNTDHGFMLGEHEWMGKNMQPCYNEITHLPFFVWDPRTKQSGARRAALAQTVDLAPTLLGFFGLEAPAGMDGADLAPAIENDTPIRKGALFGVHGGHANVTDGRTTYMRAPRTAENGPLFDYTLMPTSMNARFPLEALQDMELVRAEWAGCQVLKIPARPYVNAYWYGDLLFDLGADPGQQTNLRDEAKALHMLSLLCSLMRKNSAPAEQFTRLGLPEKGEVTAEWLAGPGAAQPYALPESLAGVPLTAPAQRAAGVLLTLMPAAQGPLLAGGIAQAAQSLPENIPVDEAMVFALLQGALPGPMAATVTRLIKGYLMYS